MKSSVPILPIREMTADHITKIALTLLKLQHITAWRQTNNAAKRWKGTVNKGVSDILGYTHHSAFARFVACEVKKIGDRLSEEQRDFLAGISHANGIALVACQINNQVELVPFEEFDKKPFS